MKRIIPAAAVLFLVAPALSAPAEAKPNTITALEAVGLSGIAVPRPSLIDGLPERTALDASAFAEKSPKTKKDDPAPSPDAVPAKGSKPTPAAEAQKKAK